MSGSCLQAPKTSTSSTCKQHGNSCPPRCRKTGNSTATLKPGTMVVPFLDTLKLLWKCGRSGACQMDKRRTLKRHKSSVKRCRKSWRWTRGPHLKGGNKCKQLLFAQRCQQREMTAIQRCAASHCSSYENHTQTCEGSECGPLAFRCMQPHEHLKLV